VKTGMKKLQPYQIFFPLGWFYGLWGALVWPLFAFVGGDYPGQLHASLMAGGFFLCFAAGFILTAVPRFTGGEFATPTETLGTALLLAWPATFIGGNPVLTFHLAGLLVMSSLLYFYVQRRRQGTFEIPEHFDWVAWGCGFGALGCVLFLANDLGLNNPRVAATGAVLTYQCFIISQLVGVGARMIPALLGWNSTSQVIPISSLKKPTYPRLNPRNEHRLLLFAFCTGVLIEAVLNPVAGRILRAGVVSWIAFRYWRLHRLPRTKGRLPQWLWIGGWSLVAGLWTHALIPSLHIHALHLVFVSGLSWMILVVATRVTLAHGGYGLALEYQSRSLLAAGLLLLLAAATRLSAPFLPASYFRHLAYAAITWVAGLIVWGVVFVPKILFSEKPASHGGKS